MSKQQGRTEEHGGFMGPHRKETMADRVARYKFLDFYMAVQKNLSLPHDDTKFQSSAERC